MFQSILVLSLLIASIDGVTMTVSLTFSNGLKSHVDAANVLKTYGFNATFYINSNNLVFLPDYMNVFDVDNLVLQQFEIGGHTKNNTDLTTVNSVKCVDEVCFDRGQLLANGWIVKSFDYPTSNYNAFTDTIVKQCGYSSAQIQNYPETSPSNPYHLGSVVVTPSSTLSDLTSPISSQSSNVIIYNFVGVVSTNSSSVFFQFLEWLKTQRTTSDIAVVSIDWLINGTFTSILAPYSSIPPTPAPDRNAFIKIMVGACSMFVLGCVIVYVAITSRCKGKCKTKCCAKKAK